MLSTATFHILAAQASIDTLGTDGVNTFFTATRLGNGLGSLLGIVGVLILIRAGMKSVKAFADGKIGDGVKSIIGAAFISALLLFPSNMMLIIGVLNNIFKVVAESINSFT
jgi:hypothetical protein